MKYRQDQSHKYYKDKMKYQDYTIRNYKMTEFYLKKTITFEHHMLIDYHHLFSYQ